MTFHRSESFRRKQLFVSSRNSGYLMKIEGLLIHSEELVHPSIYIWRYSPFRSLVSLIRRLNSSLFSALLLHLHIPSSFSASLWTTPAHLVLGLPTGLMVQKFPFKMKSWSLYPFPRPVTAVHIILPHILKVDKNNNLPSNNWISMWSLMKLSDKILYASTCMVLYTLSVPLEVPCSD